MATELKIFPPPWEFSQSQVLPLEGGRFLIDTLSGPVTLYLPHRPHPGVDFDIYDRSRNAANNSIVIRTLFGELINGAPTLTLSNNGDAATIFREDDTDNFIATISGITSGGGGGGGGGVPSPRVHDNVAQMAADPLYNQATMFYARGLFAPGDNQGGGFYIWDSLNNDPADGNQIVQSVFTGIGRFVQISS